MRKSRSGLVLSVLLVFGLVLAFAPEDLLETAYDESETQPYLGMPVFAGAALATPASLQQPRTSRDVLATVYKPAMHCRREPISARSPNVGVPSTSPCTLRC